MAKRMDAGEIERRYDALAHELNEVEQILGEVLGYPRYVDDPKNFPYATEADGVCVGELVLPILAEQAANRILEYEAERKNKIFIPIELRGCLLSTIQKSKDFLADMIEMTETKLPDAKIDEWRVELAEYEAVLEVLVGKEKA